MLFWGKIFCFGVSERHGVRSRMLLCDNGLERAAGRHRQSLIGPDSDKGGDVANTQLTVPYTFFFLCVWGRSLHFKLVYSRVSEGELGQQHLTQTHTMHAKKNAHSLQTTRNR